MSKPKILFYDIETSPNLGYIWGKYEQNVLSYTKEWELLSFAYKWEGDRTVRCFARPQFKCPDDKMLAAELHKLLSEADVVVAHNGDAFDNKKATARFIYHGFAPLKPLVSIDTRKVARKYFNFNSNSLNDLGQYLKLGKKVETGGFSLWTGCLNGDKKSWSKMIKYNKQDVALLEKVYNKFKPWVQNHPSVSLMLNKQGCATCGSSKLQRRGTLVTKKRVYHRIVCTSCGNWDKVLNKE